MRESHQLLEPHALAEHSLNQPVCARARTSPIVWLNLVCLDAPIVAITWQWLFAESFHVSLSIATRAALFLTGWLIYLADRLADTWTLGASQPRSLRQQFCQRNQISWFVAIAALTLIDLWIISRHLDRAMIRIGISLGAISIAYLCLNYWLGVIWRVLPIKEICIGSLFAAGTAAAFIPRLELSAMHMGTLVCFAALCSLNCIAIAIWERELDRAQGKDSIATRWNRVRHWYRVSVVVLGIFGITIGVIAGIFPQLYICIAASVLLLGLLDWFGDKIQRDQRTALADLVLLTPLLLFLFRA